MRERESDAIFNNASSGFTEFGKIVVQVFFTPIVAATSLLLPSLLLLIANVCLALGYMVEFGYAVKRRQVSNIDKTLTIFLILASIMLSVYISPLVLSTSMTFVMVWIAASQIATAINVAYIAAKFINPPLQRLIEWVASCFGHNIKQLYCMKVPLNLEDDRFVIEYLLKEPLTPQNQPKLDSYNHLLNMWCQYSSKYQEQVLGKMRLEKRINKLKEYVDILTDGREARVSSEGLDFIKRKITYKLIKISDATKAMVELNKAYKKEDCGAFERFGLRFFSAEPPVQQLPKIYRDAYHALLEERYRQECKVEALIKCLIDETDVKTELNNLNKARDMEYELDDASVECVSPS